MNLQIDAGNTRLKWRVRHQGETLVSGAGEYGDTDIFVGAGRYAVTRVLVSAVISDEARRVLSARISRLFGCRAEFYRARRAECGIRSSYDCPESLGADRWHAMIAARALSEAGQVIVDAGSALTIDFLSAKGRHLGGYILPGRQLMMTSLQLQTANVCFHSNMRQDVVPGQSTQDAVLSGLNWLCTAVGDRIRIDAERRGLAQILLTGGDAGHLVKLGFHGEHYPDLVLDGLELAAMRDVSP